MHFKLLSLFFVFFVLFLNASNAQETRDVVFAQIVHRHGARTPIAKANSSLLCPKPLGCGVLTINGKDMLVELGKSIRERYAGSTWFPQGTSYDFNKVYSRSTSIPRTLQSSDAFLLGLFPNMTDYYPVVFTENLALEDLILIENNPSFISYFRYILNDVFNSLKPLVDSSFDRATIDAIIKEAHYEYYCSQRTLAQCLVDIQDIGACWFSEGLFKNNSAIEANLSKLFELLRQYYIKAYMYHKNIESDRNRGSPGQPLAQKMISNMFDYVSGNQPYALFEYSAHDTTLVPLCVTLGANEEMMPLYGQYYLLELLKNANNQYFVRAWKGFPPQAPGNHKYPEPQPLVIRGIFANGTEYSSDNKTDIALQDFARYIDSSKPQSDMGKCFISDDVRRWMKCDDPAAPSPGSDCARYRSLCMQYACPKDYYLSDYSDYSCSSSKEKSSNKKVVWVSIITAIAGIVVGALCLFLIFKFTKRLK